MEAARDSWRSSFGLRLFGLRDSFAQQTNSQGATAIFRSGCCFVFLPSLLRLRRKTNSAAGAVVLKPNSGFLGSEGDRDGVPTQPHSLDFWPFLKNDKQPRFQYLGRLYLNRVCHACRNRRAFTAGSGWHASGGVPLSCKPTTYPHGSSSSLASA